MTAEQLARAQQLDWHGSNDADQQAEVVARYILAQLRDAIDQRGQASLALSGGRGPERFLRRLDQAEIDWDKVTITQVDERWVPPEHEQSNAGLIQRCMPQALAQATWLPMYQGKSLQADAHYCHSMLAPLQLLDVVVLGMGPDGHTASLFPHMPNLAEHLSEQTQDLCIAVPEEGERLARLSMTAAVINRARCKLLVLNGEDKQAQLATALDTGDALKLPIAAFLTPPMAIFYSP